MRRVLTRAAAAAVILAAGLHAQSPGAPPAVAAPEIVERTSKYVEAYLEAFSAVVSEEKQTQTILQPDGRVKKVREITADFLLVKTRPAWPDAFRDVIEVDGKPVRNREERLRKLFLNDPKSAPELAAAIGKESGRYNLGVNRVGNSPLLPLIYLTPRIAGGVRFTGSDASLTFEETRVPTVLKRRTGGTSYDMPGHGSYVIEPGTGRVLEATLTADNPESGLAMTLAVRYAVDPALAISVPVEVTERYWYLEKPKEDVLEVRAAYSKFRKFQVTTGEEIKR